MMKTFIDAATVARMIGMTCGASFLAARVRLEDDCGFPQPLPTCLRPLKWRQDAVQAWVSAQGKPKDQTMSAAQIENAGPNVTLLHEARSA